MILSWTGTWNIRINVKFCVQLEKSATETLSKLTAIKQGIMQCLKWHGYFKSRRTSLSDMQSGRPVMSVTPGNVEKINLYMRVIWGQSMMLLMWHVATNFSPHLFTTEQKGHCIEVCQDLCQHAIDDPSFMSRITSSDKSWIYSYNPETKPFIYSTKEATTDLQLNICRSAVFWVRTLW